MQPETKQLGEMLIEAGLITPAQFQDAVRHQRIAGGKGALVTGALQAAIFNSANFSSIATDEKGVIQVFNVGAERMLGYVAADVVNKITPADISDSQEVIARAKALSEKAWPIHQLQADLGDTDLATTSVYLHVIDPERERSANGRPALRLPGEPAAAAEASDTGGEASAILAALGWRRQTDGSWLPPGRRR
jgi:hypothetical protein